jgi:hypothetical protein
MPRDSQFLSIAFWSKEETFQQDTSWSHSSLSDRVKA